MQLSLTTLTDLNYKHLLRTRRFAVAAVALVIITLLTALLGLWSQAMASWQAYQDWTDQQQTLTDLNQKATQLESLATDTDFNAQLGQVGQVLPSRKPLIELLSSLSTVAEIANVSFSNIELSPGSIATTSAAPTTIASRRRQQSSARSGTNEYDTLKVEVSIQGSLFQINQFLQQIERIAPISTVTNLSLSPVSRRANLITAGEGDLFEAQLEISSYFSTRPPSSAGVTVSPETAAEQTILTDIQTYVYPTQQAQTQIQGGGLQDLFGLTGPLSEESRAVLEAGQ